MSASASRAFFAVWLGERDAVERPAVDRCLAKVADRLRAAWSGPPPDLEAFWVELARCVPPDVDPAALPEAIAAVHSVDLHLALLCRTGHQFALDRFETEIIDRLPESLAPFGADSDRVREVQQRVRVKLLVATECSPPRLSHYRGSVPLWRWVRMVAAREAITLHRGDERSVPDGAELGLLDDDVTGPELGLIRDEYRDAFERAFREALGTLDAAERNLLRLHYKHGLTIDDLAPMLSLHRASVARRIKKTRERLVMRTRNIMQSQLAISRQEFERLVSALASRLDLTLGGTA